MLMRIDPFVRDFCLLLFSSIFTGRTKKIEAKLVRFSFNFLCDLNKHVCVPLLKMTYHSLCLFGLFCILWTAGFKPTNMKTKRNKKIYSRVSGMNDHPSYKTTCIELKRQFVTSKSPECRWMQRDCYAKITGFEFKPPCVQHFFFMGIWSRSRRIFFILFSCMAVFHYRFAFQWIDSGFEYQLLK